MHIHKSCLSLLLILQRSQEPSNLSIVIRQISCLSLWIIFLRYQRTSASATLSALDHLVEDQVNDLLDMLHLLVDLRMNDFPEKAIFVMMTA